jgi:alkyl hydroperoxide reductase subunit AhpC
MIGDSDYNVSKLYGMAMSGDAAKRTPADNQTVRNVFVIGPDKKIKPMTTGRNFDEVLRVIGRCSCQAQGRDDELEEWRGRDHRRVSHKRRRQKQYPQGWKRQPHIRIVPQPKA